MHVESLESRQLLAQGSPGQYLNRTDVERILGQAASQALSTQIITVVDREGVVLGIYAGKDSRPTGARDETGARNPLVETLTKSVTRARTAAYFQSRQDAFTTRTARFIIQDHFPHPVPNTPGGPLYGVQFSSLPGSDSLANAPAISGDPGGIPLYKSGEPVGGIGVAGDGVDRLARADLPYDPRTTNPRDPFNGKEERDVDEQVALAGAGSRYMAPKDIQATEIFLDGLRLPFTADKPATGKPSRTLADLISGGEGAIFNSATFGGGAPRGSPPVPFPTATFAGFSGQLKNTTVPGFGIVGSNDTTGDDSSFRLTKKDVNRIITRAVSQALTIRAAIRQPIGVRTIVHVAVTDRDGDVLGVFRMDDGTNFSFDVAIQKARTAAFFSDDAHAFSARAIGFLSQRFFPAGINGNAGPMFHLQDALSLSVNLGTENRAATTPKLGRKNPLRNGITIFPGGFPLYKNGQLVGAIGISGDGVDQDDIVAYAGTRDFRPPRGIRSDELSNEAAAEFLTSRVITMDQTFNLSDRFVDVRQAIDNLIDGLDDVQLPYVKFPRNPEI